MIFITRLIKMNEMKAIMNLSLKPFEFYGNLNANSNVL